MNIFNIPAALGARILMICGILGKLAIATKQVSVSPLYWRLIYRQLIHIGFHSLSIVSLTAIFSGAVLALQSYVSFSQFAAYHSVPTVVALSVIKELGPVLVGLMVAGRAGAAIAAEIASMKVSEQINALYVMAIDPLKYLGVPRLLAMVISLPVLVLIADVIGISGGYLVSVYKLNIPGSIYISNTLHHVGYREVFTGLLKAFVFGIVIFSTSYYAGYNSKAGARGVGEATTNAVVTASILILICNYIITLLSVK